MPESSQELPEYRRPPVDEVALGLQFHGPGSAIAAVVARYREAVKADYPTVQYHPQLPPPSPASDVPMPFLAPGPLASIPTPAAVAEAFGRIWLISRDDSLLVQVQADRFIYNWRKRSGDYPRYATVSTRFWEQFQAFRAVAEDMEVQLQLQQIEVSYYNWVADELPQSLYLKTCQSSQVTLPHLEVTNEPQNWMASYAIADVDLVPLGRLHCQAHGAALRSVTPGRMERASVLNLTYLAPVPPGASDGDISDAMGLGHRVIVDTFTELTTPEAHRAWERVL